MTRFQEPYVAKHRMSLDSRGRFLSLLPSEMLESSSGFSGVAQVNLSATTQSGTVRGMHGQLPPVAEAKIVRCIRGRIFDVLLDVRRDSPTFLQWVSFELSAKNAHILFIPKGYLHGFQTLDEDVEILYLHDGPYSPNSEFRINPLDPSINISWPNPVGLVSESDLAAPAVAEDFEGLSI